MPKQTIEYRCLLISPSDVSAERDALAELVNRWNAQIGVGLDARVELVRWETHATPDMADTAQNVINTKLVDECDLGIGVFWSRLGTPTASHPSGSVEEIYRLIQRGARVMVYFNNCAIPQDALRTDQYAKLQEIRTRFEQSGLLATYSDVANLREQVNLHLTKVITELLSKDRGTTTYIPGSGTMTAPTPDVRVNVRQGVSILPITGETVYPISITVQNHSPITVFAGNVEIEMKTGEFLYFQRDYLTRELQKRRELRTGESFSFNIDPEKLREHVSKGLVCAMMKDDIDRVYRSPEGVLENVIKHNPTLS
ncbi:MAG TPA: hypothetical protein VEX60_10230 [Pyrinomonadaceae bacterium]|nr:hypothetical protein [Pyrinomonadaceae bacterium]